MKKWYVLFIAIALTACTDYVNQIEDEREDWRNAQELAVLSSNSSSSSAILSSEGHEEFSSSSVKSSDSSSSTNLSSESLEGSSSSDAKSCSSEKTTSSSSEKNASSSSSAKSNGSSSSSENAASIDVNDPPLVRDTMFSIDENLANGSSVGKIIAFDPDTIIAYCTLIYAIIESDVPFILDSNIIKVGDSSRLDYEVNPVFTFHVRVCDRELCDTALVVVNLNDVNEMMSSSSSGKASWAYLNPAISYGEMTDDRDGQVYKTVVIGEQTWMAENLNLETMNSFCYNDSASNCAKYGRLYTWTAAMDSLGEYSNDGKGCGYHKNCEPTYPVQGICPTNWHLPTKEEFEALLTAIGGEYVIGAQWSAGETLKSTTGWINNGNGLDTYGFSASPAGLGTLYKNFNYKNEESYFHTSTAAQGQGTYSYYMELNSKVNAIIGSHDKNLMLSIRCLENSPNIVLNSSSSAVVEVSSSSTGIVSPCKTSAEDNCEYGELKDERDGQTYKTVKIGSQWWMAENLNYGMTNSYCYLDSVKYCAEWGHLYIWTAALQACPKGSHLPAKDEFEALFETVGGQLTAGKMLKSTSGWNEQNGSDAYSFTALPAGYKDYTGSYGVSYPGFWSSTEYGESSAYHMHLYQTSDYANLSNPHKSSAYSVRCIID